MTDEVRLTKRVVDGVQPSEREFTVWDADLAGFGLRVRPTGGKSYVVSYRAGTGRSAPTKRLTIGAVGRLTPDEARGEAKKILGSIAHGRDPAGEKAADRRALTIGDLIDEFLRDHVEAKRKPKTAAHYRSLLDTFLRPALGSSKAKKVSRPEISRLHRSLAETPYQANRLLSAAASMFAFAEREGHVPEGSNPARGVERFREDRRERFLTTDELERLGAALREAETDGIPYEIDETKPKAKHSRKPENRLSIADPYAVAALRLLLFTGARVGEILSLRWQYVDLERGLLLLPDSKTGRKIIVLNAPASALLTTLRRQNDFVISGSDAAKPRADLKRPWAMISTRAGLSGVRLHDLRHTFASFGAGRGLGLPIIGRLLGHTQPATTARYAHLDADPVRRAADSIGGTIAAALDGSGSTSEVLVFPSANNKRAAGT